MAIKTIKLPDGRMLEIDEWLDYPIFSTIEAAATTAIDLRAFTYVVGQRVPAQGAPAGSPRNATETDTNQVARARMNHDEEFIAFSITYEVFALTDATDTAPSPDVTMAPDPIFHPNNLRRLQRDVVVELMVGAGITKPQFRAPFSYIGQAVGSPGYGPGDAVAANVRVAYGTAGRIASQNQRRWQLPIRIGSDRVMTLKVFAPAGSIADCTQDYRLRWYLNGIKRRPVA